MPADDLAAGIAELDELLARLSRGDTALRATVNSENDIFSGLKTHINQLAEYIQETNDYSHEMAIGLCENYEILSRIAHGDFSARVTMDSKNEVIAKLGELINLEADSLTSTIFRVKQTEEANQTQLQFSRVLLDTIPNPIFYKDTNCRYLGCNKAFEAYVGISQDELIGKTPHELWPKELAESYRQQDLEMLENPGTQLYETTVRFADGCLRDVIFNKATFNESDGSLGGLVCVVLDITERKRTEEAVAFQNILLSTQQEASIDGILVVDETAKIISFNHRFVEIMGIPSQLLESREDEPVLQYVTARMVDPESFLEKVRYLYEHKHESSRDEISLCDGKTLDRYTVPLLGADGRYYGRLWSFRDITDRKSAEDDVKNAYQQLMDIVEFLPDATFVVDKEKRVIAWNRAIEKLTGLEKNEVIGKGDYVYAIPFYGKPRPILIDLLDEDKEIESHNYTLIKKEGRTLFTEAFVPSFRKGDSRYFWATASPLLDKNGNKVGAIESIRDITEYKQAEEERLRLESRLHHARMIESFMIRLGHDLRTPLTPLTILLPLIRKQVVDPDLLKLVDICCKSAVSMKKLADKAQLLGSLATEIKTGELECVTLASLVELSLADSADIMAQKNISCKNEVAPDIVVNVITDQIKETFANLISNAVHFSLENGVIRIDAKQHNGTVTVSVQDNGIGLHPGILEHIFDEFFKADESRHDLDAPGLGLTICKRIVSNHHGRIWAESPGLGKGTTIKFTINEKDDNSRIYEKEQ